MYVEREKPPEIFDTSGVALAGILYAGIILLAWGAKALCDKPKETVVPIDMTIVVHENLDGAPDEPPPEAPPQPEPPKPDPPPRPKPPDKVPDALVRETPKTNRVEKAVKEKETAKTPPKPQKDAKTLREERLARMRASTTKIKAPKTPPPRNNGRTEASPPDLARLLADPAFRAGSRNSGLDAGDDQRCIRLIHNAFHDKWSSPVKTGGMGEMLLRVQFTSGGAVKGFKLVKSSGDAAADRSVLEAAGRVGRVYGLSPGFLERNRNEVTVRFTVK